MEEVLARAVQLLVALAGAYVIALWFALVVWTFQDIQRRSRSVIAQIFSTLVVVLFWLPGVLIYLILRPKDTLDETFQRSLEEEYLLQDLEELPLCPNCQRYVQEDFAFCPNCRTELRQPCIGCERLIDLRWDVCPYCGVEQYPEEEALPEPATWDQAEPARVGRLMTGARDRLSTRWSKLPAESTLKPEIPASVTTKIDDSRLAGAGDGAKSDNGWSARDRHASPDGNGARSYAAPWDAPPHDEPESPLERTDELPTSTKRPQS